jgi:hypothetical protein
VNAVSTGLAAGNGSAPLPTSKQWAGLAPNADLLIVKMTSEGAPAHSGQPAENPFQGCMGLALDLVMQEAATLKEPIVAMMDSGTEWGPIDNTGVVSQKINADYNSPGNIYVAPSGDEGNLPNHAQVTFTKTATVLNFNKTSTSNVDFQAWYTGSVPANVSLTMSDTGATASVAPGNNCSSSTDGILVLTGRCG